ncbi:MAG: hypothetical protein KDA52_13050 [Planctomycetaceae bacterium]|nr:hypothetical protein [Planctomycetaceae bacterium]
MPFKLPKLPSPRARLHELADFAEILSWKQSHISEREIISFLGRVDDNEHNDGVNDDEEETTNLLPLVMNELERRSDACRDGYPFTLERRGTVLNYSKSRENETTSIVYRYLLLSTRLNMKTNKVHADIDGTKLLEHLSAHVLKTYLGNNAKSFVFGTAKSGEFRAKVENLCKALNEGVGYRKLDEDAIEYAVDDKLDAVGWVPFSDLSPGQLILFGQCKTGDNWNGTEFQLQPTVFAKRWLKESFLVDPQRAFCISEALDRTRWKSTNVAAGIVFDRCRLVDFCWDFDTTEMRIWTQSAFSSFEIGDLK